MRYYWARDHIKQAHFHVVWRPGTENCADYFTKHHPHIHHHHVRYQYLLDPALKQTGLSRTHIATRVC